MRRFALAAKEISSPDPESGRARRGLDRRLLHAGRHDRHGQGSALPVREADFREVSDAPRS